MLGAQSGGFSSLGTPASTDLVGTDPAQSGLVFGFLNIFRGGAVMIGPIIATALHQKSDPSASVTSSPNYHPKFGGYGFTSVEIFVGSMMGATALGGFLVMFLRRGEFAVGASGGSR